MEEVFMTMGSRITLVAVVWEEWTVDTGLVEEAIINTNSISNCQWGTEWWEWVVQEVAFMSTEAGVVAQCKVNNTEPRIIRDLHQAMFPTKPAGVSKFLLWSLIYILNSQGGR